MGSVFEVCRGMCDDQEREFFMISSQSPNISVLKENKKQDLKTKKIKKYLPYNVSNEIIINTNNEIPKINSQNQSGNENELLLSIDKLSQMIESLEYKNRVLEKEKKELKEEKDKLAKELEICKNKTMIKRISSMKNSDNKELQNSYNNNIGEKLKLIFIFKYMFNNKNNDNESKEELFAYKNEMFIEVKLRLLNKRKLHPGAITMCYFNKKEINDWFTLNELNIQDNSQIICEVT